MDCKAERVGGPQHYDIRRRQRSNAFVKSCRKMKGIQSPERNSLQSADEIRCRDHARILKAHHSQGA